MLKHKTLDQIKERFDPTENVLPHDYSEQEGDIQFGEVEASGSMPTSIKRKIERRIETEKQFAAVKLFEPGHIVRIEIPNLSLPSGQSTEMVAVLLNQFNPVKNSWNGWLVSRDPDFASNWDLILGAEDQPRDPICEVVQVWNPVQIGADAIVSVLGRLSAYRLGAVRALAYDFETNQTSMQSLETRVGVRVARELTDGTGVVTGALISNTEDVRHKYQEIYRKVAKSLEASLANNPTQSTEKELLQTISEFLSGQWSMHMGRTVGLAFAVLVVPILLVSFLHEENKSSSGNVTVADSPPLAIEPQHKFISDSAVQEIRSEHPESVLKELDTLFSKWSCKLETSSFGPSGTEFSVRVPLESPCQPDWQDLDRKFSLKPVSEQHLRILVTVRQSGK